jgi:predicted extracellular nuclease
MNNLRRILLTAGLAIATTGFASADSIITQTLSLPSGSTTTSWPNGGSSGSGSISQFDTSLGTLESIEIIGVANTTVNAGAVDATGSTGGDSYTIGAATNLSLKDGAGNLLVAPTTSVSSTFNNQSNGSSMNVTNASASDREDAIWIIDPSLWSVCGSAGSGLRKIGCFDKIDSSVSSPVVNPLDYLNFEGGSTIAIAGTAATAGSFSGPSYSGAFSNGTAALNVTVIYDYIPTQTTTPEPTTMVLFGSALLGLGLIRRRQKS